MNCPYCNKSIEAMTGFMEVTKFQKHLRSCKKNPERVKLMVTPAGGIIAATQSLKDALEIRANSGQ
jgi:hypothetical protein